MMFLEQFGARIKQLLNAKADKGTTLGAYGITDAINVNQKGAANGVASLGADMKVPASQLPSFVDDVLEYSTLSSLPVMGESGKIYTVIDTNKIYRWSGSVYIEISPTAGNADTATKMATPRNINGVAFDGTKDITINAVDSTARIAASEKGAASGVASLGADGKVLSSQLPAIIAGLSDAGHSFSGNGYLKLSNGLIIQWGVSASVPTSGSTSVVFPIAFPNAICSVLMTHIEATTAASYAWSVGNILLSSMTIYSNGGRAGQKSWFAIGY